MNTEVIKAMNRKPKKHTVKNWWNKNSYKIFRIILFPFWIIAIIKNRYNDKANKKQEWNEQKANEILNYYIPRYCSWSDEDNTFYFFDNGYGWGWHSAKRFIKRKDKRFWKLHNGFWGGEIRDYLIHTFELEGFTKEIGDCSDGWTEISFIMKQNS